MDEQRTVTVFLDFDGTVHPALCKGSEAFSWVPRVEQMLRSIEPVEIVISSSWRWSTPLEEMKVHLSPWLASRVIDITPRFETGRREMECLAWLRANGRPERCWIALDDDPAGFMDTARMHLVEIDGVTGPTDATAARVIEVAHTARVTANWPPFYRTALMKRMRKESKK